MKTKEQSHLPKPESLAVIGGGAAGFFAAVNVAHKSPETTVTVFEAAAKPLQKVFISGGGRCNVTHGCFDPRLLLQHYPRGQKELPSVLARFQPKDTVEWFARRGLMLKTESDGRMFPVSDRSQDVIDCLRREAHRSGVELLCGARVSEIKHENGQFWVHSKPFDAVLLATGYSPPGWQLAASLGHTIIPPVPSLFPFKIQSLLLQDLQGLSMLDVAGRLTVGKEKFEARGPVLITHLGLSGPVIYRLSALGARALAGAGYQASVRIDWLPETSEETLRADLTRLFFETDKQKKIANTQLAPFAHRLWLSLLTASGADLEAQAAHLTKKAFNKLIELLKRCDLPVTGKSPSKEEFVSCGGVDCREVNFQTMESKIMPGLYFAGEILNIDGLTGGFNFQSAWSTGWVVSEALA